jgi:hypothetical protein
LSATGRLLRMAMFNLARRAWLPIAEHPERELHGELDGGGPCRFAVCNRQPQEESRSRIVAPDFQPQEELKCRTTARNRQPQEALKCRSAAINRQPQEELKCRSAAINRQPQKELKCPSVDDLRLRPTALGVRWAGGVAERAPALI